jgi:hypothetical protein
MPCTVKKVHFVWNVVQKERGKNCIADLADVVYQESHLVDERKGYPCYVGPCHHSMTRPRIALGGECVQERSCKHVE